MSLAGRDKYKSDGPSSGIGLETSLLFAQEGANVVLADINLAAVQSVANLIKERYPKSIGLPVKCDVSKEVEVKATVDAAVSEFGRVDVMVSSTSLSRSVRSPSMPLT